MKPESSSYRFLGQLCTRITDGTHQTPAYQDEGVIFISAKNIKDGKLDFTDRKYIAQEEHNFLTKSAKPSAGDLLLTKSGSLGDVAVIPTLDFEFSIFESLALLKPRRDLVDSHYLYQYIRSPEAAKYFHGITTGLAVKHLHLGDLRKLKVFLPTLERQRAISEQLSTWDTAIQKTEQLIAAKERHYSPELSRLISRGQHPHAHVGAFAGEVSARNRGGNEARVLSVTNRRGFVLPEDQFERRVASADLSNYKIVRRGQYAYNPSRINVGSIARLDSWDDGVLSPMYVVFRLDEEKVNSDYFLHWLDSHEARQRIKNSAQGSVRETVSFSEFAAITVPLPDTNTQTAIARYLNALREEIDLLGQSAAALKAQKRGLMQKLLAGEWRLPVHEEAATA